MSWSQTLDDIEERRYKKLSRVSEPIQPCCLKCWHSNMRSNINVEGVTLLVVRFRGGNAVRKGSGLDGHWRHHTQIMKFSGEVCFKSSWS